MKFWETMAPEFRESIKQAGLARQRGESVPGNYVLRTVTKSGDACWVRAAMSTISYRGQLAGLGVVIDITEQKRAEEALRESESRFRAIFEQVAVGMAHVGLDGRLLLVNQKLSDILGYTVDELQQKSCSEVTHPGDREATKKAAQRVLSGKDLSFVLEKRSLRKDGTVVWTRVTSVLVRSGSGVPLYYVDVMEDISMRKQIEAEQARLIAILENTPDFVATTTIDGRGIYMNRATRELFGLLGDEELRKWQGPQAYTEQSREIVSRQGIPTALRSGIWSGDVSVVRHTGEEIPTSHVILAHKDETGRAQYLSVIARDISEQEKARETLQTFSRRILDAQEQERRRLACELHDELGQVLSAVKLTLQNISRRPINMPERIKESVDMVQSALEQVRILSRNLRPLMLDDLGLVAALRWYADQHEQLTHAHVEFLADVPDQRFSPEVEIVCFRVAPEALTNIMRHAQAENVWIEIHYHDEALHLLVQDDGVGFDVEAVFADMTRRSNGGLLGMRERAQLVNGHVQITSIIGEGTEVRAMFPVALTHDQDIQPN
ncbi:MAG: PAS domain S-box protein [Deltaproteobacteria bacterium]|nr:PAS domain S-box protein [Deltaproteobacteria bacterium]